MRMAFDIDRFQQALDRAIAIPCTDAKHKMAMTAKLGSTVAAILTSVESMGPPKTPEEGLQMLITQMCTALSIGFDAGRMYEEMESKSRIELVQ